MDPTTGVKVAKNVADLAKNENILNKSAGLMGMLFPYVGIEQKAVKMYIEEIEKSDMSPEAKAFAVLSTKKKFKEFKNQQKIAEIAIKNSKEGTDFSKKSGVSEEWLDRFMDSARFVSSEEMQLVWGKILANELNVPGSTPPNMIRVLSEITPELARAFRCICSMSVWFLPLKEDGNIETSFRKIFVPYNMNDDILREAGLSFKVLNELETLGVVKFDSIAGYVSKGIYNKKILLCIGDKLNVIEDHKDGEVPIGNVLLTSVGEALRSITECIEIDNYAEMINTYMQHERVKFSEEHCFMAKVENNVLNIVRKDQT